MTAFFAICDADGGVRGAGQCPEEDYLRQGTARPGGIIARIDQAKHDAIMTDIQGFRLLAGEVIPRDAMPIAVSNTNIQADGADSCAITGIPVGAIARITGAINYGPAAIEDGELTLTLSMPGVLRVSLELSPTYKPYTVSINASA